MKGSAFLIAAGILLLLGVSLTSGQDEEDCPYNEVEVDCVNNCNFCRFVNRTCRVTDECEPGCDCKAGYLRNKFGYCIPRRYCGASGEEPPTDGGRADANSGGCPNSQFCILSCKRRGFGTGLCLGPRRGYCNCYTPPPGQETPPNREDADSGGCPNIRRCVRSCKRRGFTDGLCLGPRRADCSCYNIRDEEREDEATSGGCPNTSSCILHCKMKNFKNGECFGPNRGYCNCYNNSRNHGCPNKSLCEAFCKRNRYSTGVCIGDRRLNCRCSGKF